MDDKEKEIEMPKEDLIEHYSSILCKLWESYTRFLHVGMVASGLTVV